PNGIVLEQYVKPFFRQEGTDSFHFFSIQNVQKPRGAELFEDIGQLKVAEELVIALWLLRFIRGENDDRQTPVEIPQQTANSFLQVLGAHEDDGLIHVVELDLLIGLFFEKISLANFAALEFDAFRHRRVLDQKQHLRLFGGNVAHEM